MAGDDGSLSGENGDDVPFDVDAPIPFDIDAFLGLKAPDSVQNRSQIDLEYRVIDTQLIDAEKAAHPGMAADYLCFNNSQEMDTFILEDKQFQAHFSEYANYYRKLKDKGKQKQTRFDTAFSRLKTHEETGWIARAQPGNRELASFDDIDWHAWLLYHLQMLLCHYKTGHFKQCTWRKEIQFNRMWLLIARAKILLKRETSSPKTALAQDLQAATEDPATKLKTIQTLQKLQEASQTVISSKTKGPKRLKTASSGRQLKQQLVDLIKKCETDDRALAGFGDKEWEELIKDIDDDVIRENTMQAPPVKLPTQLPQERMSDEDVRKHIISLVQRKSKSGESLSSEEESQLSQILLMSRALMSSTDKSLSKVLQCLEVLGQSEPVETGQEISKTTAQMDEAAVAMDEFAQAVGGFAIRPTPRQAEDEKENDLLTEMLNSTEFERTDLKAACKRLGLQPHKRFQHPLTRRGINFSWWQICAIHSLCELHETGLTRGGLLSTDVGLGKTFTMGGYILHRKALQLKNTANHLNRNKARHQKAIIETHRSKPWLVIVPAGLLVQTAVELNRLSAHFKIVLMHGDSKTRLQIAEQNVNVTQFTGTLDRTSSCLYSDKLSEQVIILTSKETFANNCGPKAQKEWAREHKYNKEERKKQALTPKQVNDFLTKNYLVYDKDWPAGLRGVFEGVWIDEIHQVFTNPDTLANVSVRWLDCEHVFGTSATLMWSGVYDMHGYLALLEKPETVQAYKNAKKELPAGKKKQEDWDLINPFLAENAANDGNQLMKLSSENFNDTFKRKKLDLGSTGQWLKQILSSILVRHHHASACPIGTENTISKHLPNCFENSIELKFTPKQKLIYDRYAGEYESRLFMNLKESKSRVAINSNSYRALSTLAAMPSLGAFGIKKDHESLHAQSKKLREARAKNVANRRDQWRSKRFKDMFHDQFESLKSIPGGMPKWRQIETRMIQLTEAVRPEPQVEIGSDDESELEDTFPDTELEPDFEETHVEIGGKLIPLMSRHKREEMILQVFSETPDKKEFERDIWYRLDEYSFMEIDQLAWAQFMTDEKNVPEEFKNPAIGSDKGGNYVYFLAYILMKIRSNDDDHERAAKQPDVSFTGKRYVTSLNLEVTTPVEYAALKEAVAKNLVDNSPKLRLLLQYVLGCVARKSKAAIWAMWPFLQVFYTAFLRLFDIEAQPYLAEHDANHRAALLKGFSQREKFKSMGSEEDNDGIFCTVMVCSYATGGVGLNMQIGCSDTLLMDGVPNIACKKQVLGRFYRFGQLYDVWAFEAWVKGSWDETINNRVLQRALPQIMAMLDANVLANAAGLKNDDEEHPHANLDPSVVASLEDLEGFYVKKEGPFQIKHVSVFSEDDRSSDFDGPYPGWKRLERQELLTLLFHHMRGRPMSIEMTQEPAPQDLQFIQDIEEAYAIRAEQLSASEQEKLLEAQEREKLASEKKKLREEKKKARAIMQEQAQKRKEQREAQRELKKKQKKAAQEVREKKKLENEASKKITDGDGNEHIIAKTSKQDCKTICASLGLPTDGLVDHLRKRLREESARRWKAENDSDAEAEADGDSDFDDYDA